MMVFREGAIDGVKIEIVEKYFDDRGWLLETFRQDEVQSPYLPVMGYVSESLPGVTRGPHEHVGQSDLFVFIGPGTFKVWLWDNRKSSPTYYHQQVFLAGDERPTRLLVPPGVAHAYKNISSGKGIVHNFPNQLYRGRGKKSPVDEIRHEIDPNSPFKAV
jgi:dTDP-4-dehydrorhamnose 3,5-epimerase